VAGSPRSRRARHAAAGDEPRRQLVLNPDPYPADPDFAAGCADPAGSDPDPAAHPDPAALAALAEERIATAAGGQRRLAGRVGRAESPDGRVRAGVNTAQGLCELHLDPRALRLPAADLAATILRVTDAARQDLARQAERAVREAYGEDFDPFRFSADPAR